MSMIASPLDSASRWLNWSNVLYVGGAALTVATAMFVLWENRAIASGNRVKYYLLSEFAVALAAIVSLIGTIGAIHFSNTVSHIKDTDLATYKEAARVEISLAKADAAESLAKTVAEQLQIDQLSPTVATLKSSQMDTDKSLQSLRRATAARAFDASPDDIKEISKFSDVPIEFVSHLSDNEARRVVSQIGSFLLNSGFPDIPDKGFIGPDYDSPLARHGIHIFYGSQPRDHELATALGKIIRSKGLEVDVSAGDGKTLSVSKQVVSPKSLQKGPWNNVSVFFGPKA